MEYYCVECNVNKVNKPGQKCPECQKREAKRQKTDRAYERDTRKNWNTQERLRELGEK